MKTILTKLPALGIYILGMTGLVVADIVISKFYSIEQVASWALIKSALLLASAICTFGFDQVIVRRPAALREILYIFVPTSLFSAGIAAFFLGYYSSDRNYIFWFAGIILLVGLTIFFSIFRGGYLMAAAQFSLNGWKLLFLAVIALPLVGMKPPEIDIAILTALLVAVAISTLYAYLNTTWVTYYSDKRAEAPSFTPGTLIKDAKNFFFLAISLNASLNFEQIVLGGLNSPGDAATLLAHFSIFMPLIVFLNGFIAFYLGPYFQRNEEILTREFFMRGNMLYAAVGLLFSFASFFGGILFFSFFYSGKYHLNIWVAILLTLLGYLRYLYSIPSSYVAVLSKSVVLGSFSNTNIAALGVGVFVLFALLFLQTPPLIAVLIASTFNWILRVAIGYKLALAGMEEKRCAHYI